MITQPPIFTPKLMESRLIVISALTWGIVVDPSCKFLDKRHILCTVNFPPINGKYLGWDLTLSWDGQRIKAQPLVVPEV